ncbi:vacuolar protein sorting-associated protein Vps17 [Trichodelitschia bisporula]|uniref:Vacuolar protein sorting-associated protein 17 n=1 Tax=Trichodelitschia bisporula TaxID=703511 RepID=A0A6G1HY38_9PEZI|nr:vacuolar protein sorting-associated protein Vps17 [Trichodelitschia bisporula]
MDYSALPAEEQSSPWASSPQHSRSYEHPTGDIPSAPLSPPPQYGDQAHIDRSLSDDTGFAPAPQAGGDDGQGQPQQPQQQPGSPQQQPRSSSQRYHSGARPRPQTQYKLQAKVTGLERTGRKDPILRFDVYTNLPKFRTTQFRDVRRTHAEFVKFAEHLISANPEALVPAVPPPVTSAGAGTEEDEIRVKTNMQRWLNVVCSNEVLIRDEEMIFFVESDFGYSPVVRRKQPATGVRRKMIKQFAPPPDDTPELADARPVVKMFYLETMGAGQKVDKVVKTRRSLGLSESALGLAFSQMAPQEHHPGLAVAYRKLGATIRAVGDFHLAQGTFEASTLSDPLAYHSSDAFIVKETLTNRQILMRELLQAETTTRSKISAADRLRASSSVKRDKVDEAIASLEEAKRTEEQLAKKCKDVTANLKGERRRWFDRTAADLRTALREYVCRQIEAERRTLATLEAVRPDIRAIDASGGLSRLGREAHPKVRRSSLASSQGPKGDAWSGVPRRPDGVRRADPGTGGLVAPQEDEEEVPGIGRERAASGSLKGLVEEDDEDRVDARNAASRLAQTSF